MEFRVATLSQVGIAKVRQDAPLGAGIVAVHLVFTHASALRQDAFSALSRHLAERLNMIGASTIEMGELEDITVVFHEVCKDEAILDSILTAVGYKTFYPVRIEFSEGHMRFLRDFYGLWGKLE